MELVRSRCRLVRDYSLRQSVLSRKGRTQDVEFIDLFEWRVPDGLKALSFGLSHGNAVKHNLALEIDAAVNSLAKCSAGYAWSKENELVDLTAPTVTGVQFDRQRLNYRVFNRGTQFRLSRIQSDNAFRHFQRLRGRSGLQTHIDGRILLTSTPTPLWTEV